MTTPIAFLSKPLDVPKDLLVSNRLLLLLKGSKSIDKPFNKAFVEQCLKDEYHPTFDWRTAVHHVVAAYLEAIKIPYFEMSYRSEPAKQIERLLFCNFEFTLFDNKPKSLDFAEHSEGIINFILQELRLTRVDWLKDKLDAIQINFVDYREYETAIADYLENFEYRLDSNLLFDLDHIMTTVIRFDTKFVAISSNLYEIFREKFLNHPDFALNNDENLLNAGYVGKYLNRFNFVKDTKTLDKKYHIPNNLVILVSNSNELRRFKVLS